MTSDAVLSARIDTRRRGDQVREKIVELIRTQGLGPGDKLPTEQELMEALGVSRSSVRDALTALAGLGVIEARPGRGVFLRQLSVESVTRVMSAALHLGSQVSWRLVEARSIIEAAAGRLAAERHTPEDLQRMEEAMVDMWTAFAAGDLDKLVAADAAFHTAIAQAGHNDVLVEVLDSIQPWLIQQRREIFRRRMEDGSYTMDEVVAAHKLIVRAISDGDLDRAEQAMREHLQTMWEQVKIWPLTEKGASAGPA